MEKLNLLPPISGARKLPPAPHAARRGAVLGALALALGACSADVPPPEPTASAQLASRTISQPAVPEVLPDSELVLSGEIAADPNRLARVFPRVGGEVLRVGTDLGDEVRQGQVLAVLKSPEIAALQHQRTTTAADYEVAAKKAAELAHLEQAGLASGHEVYTARQEARRAAGHAAASQRQMGVYGVTPGETYTLRAPLAGYVLEKKLSPGMRFNATDLQAAFVVANLDQVWVMANVFESDLSRVRPGQAVEIITLSYPDAPLRGRIDQVSALLDPESKVMKVRCVLPNPGHRLKPGMHARVRVLADAPTSAASLATAKSETTTSTHAKP
ncbi:efflux RND transporter periplasmic adaptor subunit [Hymenobacter sp. BT523]|uniref:efflux RND transporter periplasmic adaptor subunit n=1 Tax=Hymenobacter sp. BT523 TaxID=2795725 RepID=UPI0018EAFA8C|nr:efflux RND transporter periplasmic adaptor subunit [Hymenobacter sp. BT523]MBJ6110118.1 efflux RND transporter periplasmic adaptor subunit [Hymenobacter sp. BT523]